MLPGVNFQAQCQNFWRAVDFIAEKHVFEKPKRVRERKGTRRNHRIKRQRRFHENDVVTIVWNLIVSYLRLNLLYEASVSCITS